MIKRPVLELGGKLLVGFKPEIYAKEVRQGEIAQALIQFDDLGSMTASYREFDDVAGRDAAGRAVKQVAVDHGAQFRPSAARRFRASDS